MLHLRIFFEVFGTTQSFPPVPKESISAKGMEDHARKELRRLRRLGKTCTLERFDSEVFAWETIA